MAIDILRRVWPEWEIEALLGKGSYGEVYRAVRRDHNVESYAAIKVISISSDTPDIGALRAEGVSEDAIRAYLRDMADDFISEIRVMDSMKGIQNIVSVEDYRVVERQDGGLYILIRMELLTPFTAYIADREISEDEVVRLGYDICTALEICGTQNIIHRDIKPENIFVNDYGYYKLGDFGIARKMENMAGEMSHKGTFNYMAPEVVNSSSYDQRVDTYSLGLVLYRLLNNNRLPFVEGERMTASGRRTAVERRICGEELPPPCNASPALASVILRACAFYPEARFRTATEMKVALVNALNGEPVYPAAVGYEATESMTSGTVSVRGNGFAPPEPELSEAVKPSATHRKKKKTKLIAVLIAVLLLAAAAVIFVPKLFGGSSEPEEESYSNAEKNEIEDIIDDAEELAAEDDYAGAVALISDGLRDYPDSSRLADKLKEYTAKLGEQKADGTVAEADKLAAEGDYAGALKLIDAAVSEYGENEKLTKARAGYEEGYEAYVNEELSKLLKANDISGAKALLAEAQLLLPDNEEIKKRAEELDKNNTVYLDNVEAVNGGFTWNEGEAGDIFGHSYDNATNYTILHASNDRHHKDYSAEYNINKKYGSLSFNVSPYTHFHEEGEAYIQVYVNNELAYTTPKITQKTQPFKVNVDIRSGSYLKIVASVDGCIILSDAMLSGSSQSGEKKESTTTPLSLLSFFNGSIPWDNEYPVNTLGGDYTKSKNYSVLRSDYHSSYEYSAEFYVNDKYKSFTMNVAPSADCKDGTVTHVYIYVDDVLAYSSPSVTRKTEMFKIDTIDLSGADYMKIVVSLEGSYSSVILSDAILKNK